MTLRDRANAFILALLITMIIFMPMAVQSQISEECCEQREFELFLVGEPDDGILTPFYDPVLTPPTQDLTWGNDNFLYQLKSNRLIKIDMVEAGALYPGRY